jgi:hypothetical protein
MPPRKVDNPELIVGVYPHILTTAPRTGHSVKYVRQILATPGHPTRRRLDQVDTPGHINAPLLLPRS